MAAGDLRHLRFWFWVRLGWVGGFGKPETRKQKAETHPAHGGEAVDRAAVRVVALLDVERQHALQELAQDDVAVVCLQAELVLGPPAAALVVGGELDAHVVSRAVLRRERGELAAGPRGADAGLRGVANRACCKSGAGLRVANRAGLRVANRLGADAAGLGLTRASAAETKTVPWFFLAFSGPVKMSKA